MAGAGESFASPARVVQTLSAVKLSQKDGELALGCSGLQIMSLLSDDPGFVGTEQASLGLCCQNQAEPGQCSCLGNAGVQGPHVRVLAFFFFFANMNAPLNHLEFL